MGRPSVHYEAAFESYLRGKDWPYVVIDEAKKTLFAGISIKSFDFVVYSDSRANLLVDVKGRKFPDQAKPSARSPRAWENWITREDIESLRKWESIFGADFTAVLVFAYWLQGLPRQAPFEDVHFFHNRYYAFLAVSLADYADCMRPRSAKWQTVSMPAGEFARLASDLAGFL